MMREPAPATLDANESIKTTDEVKNSPRMVFPGLLAFAIDEGIWPPLSNASYRTELALPFRRSSQVLTGYFGVINHEPPRVPIATRGQAPAMQVEVGAPARAGRGLYSGRRLGAGAPENYFNEALIAVNLVLSLVPSPFTTAMMARAVPAAIGPYSMAAAAFSSFRNFFDDVHARPRPVILSKQTVL